MCKERQSSCPEENLQKHYPFAGGRAARRLYRFAADTLELLSELSQAIRQWSVVYQMRRGEVSLAMGRDYTTIPTFKTADYWESK